MSNFVFSADVTNTGALVSDGWTVRYQAGGLNGRFLYFRDNGTQSIAIISDDGNNVRILRFDPETVTGNSSGVTLTVNIPAAPIAALFYPNGSDSYIFVSTATLTYFWRGINISTMSGSISQATAAATFNSGGGNNTIDFHISTGGTAYLFARNRFWRFDPATVSGSSIAATVTCSGGGIGVSLARCAFESDTLALAILNNVTAGDTTRGVLFGFNPSTDSGTISSTGAFTGAGNDATDIGDLIKINSDYYLVLARTGSSTAARFYWVFNSSVSGTVSHAGTFGNDPGQANDNSRIFMQFVDVSASKLMLATMYQNAGNFFHIRQLAYPSTFSDFLGFRSTALFAAATGVYNRIFKAGDKVVRFSSTVGASSFIQVYVNDLNNRDVLLSLAVSPGLITGSSAIRKTTGNPLTLFSTLDYFIASLLLRAGAQIQSSTINNIEYGFAFTFTGDTTGTLAENFTFDGTATITGDYRITVAGSTVALGSRTTYNESFTLDGGSTLLLNQDVALTADFILSAGTTVDGPFTLTIPYPDPGLVLTGGAAIAAPVVEVTLTQIQSGSKVRIYATGTQTELAGNDAVSGSTFAFEPSGAFDIRIFRTGFQVFRSINNPVPASDQSIQINQLIDRGYFDAP